MNHLQFRTKGSRGSHARVIKEFEWWKLQEGAVSYRRSTGRLYRGRERLKFGTARYCK